MKLIYSHLKKILPDLSVAPETLKDDLALIGHFVSAFEKVKDEYVYDLEIRQNRADCLGYYGLARDLSVFYQIPLVLPDLLSPITDHKNKLDIQISSPDVRRIQAIKISEIKVTTSPEWLINFLHLHDINPINNLVDLTNYAMIIYGIPCHAFDTKKTTENLIWENNTKYQQFTTLDGTLLSLKNNLIVSNPNTCLSLGFIGGQNSGIDASTTETILEMAIYNPSRIRSDSRSLKTITEASIRLDKYLDTELVPLAFNFLISQTLKLCGGQITSSLFEQYSQKPETISIPFNPEKPSQYAGVNISPQFATDVLVRLGCTPTNSGYIPPSIRKDLNLEEDLIEEVIRFHGYNRIPTNQPINSTPLPDITPSVLYTIEKLKDDLAALGYDEVRSWPLVQKPLSSQAIYTQNSINSEYPVLRQSMIQSLESQLDQYRRFKLPQPQFFEIGKIYWQENGEYKEKYSLGIYHYNSSQLAADLQSLNLSPKDSKVRDNFIEIDIESLPQTDFYLSPDATNQAYELTSQIITLDANVTLKTPADPQSLIREYQAKIGDHLWSLIITDIYHDQKQGIYRYTFRASYYNLDDKTAKQIHLQAFGFASPNQKKIILPNPDSETVPLYYEDMYKTEFDAQIINIKKIDNKMYLILDKTLFFPEGGGQPSDIGIIQDNNEQVVVNKVIYKNGQILHQVDHTNIQIGDKVKGIINWDNRYKYMKIHSAGHLLHEVIMSLFPNLIATKGMHGDEAYLIYTGEINSSEGEKIELLTNNEINKDIPIVCEYTDYDTLQKESRFVPSNLPRDKKLRKLKIGNYPTMADGGVQVKSTIEIGKIKITSINYSDGKSKIDYQVI